MIAKQPRFPIFAGGGVKLGAVRYLKEKPAQPRAFEPSALDVEDVCRRYGTSILRRCRGILRDPAEAEDAAQEIFITVMQKGQQFRRETDLAGWLYRITTNHCLNRLRARRRREHREQSENDWSGWEVPDPYEHFAALDRLRALFAKLDALGQQILVYHHLDGLTQEKTAALTGKSRRTVGKRIKLINRLMEQMEVETP